MRRLKRKVIELFESARLGRIAAVENSRGFQPSECGGRRRSVAERRLKDTAADCIAGHFNRRYATESASCRVPGVEPPGYRQSPLRGLAPTATARPYEFNELLLKLARMGFKPRRASGQKTASAKDTKMGITGGVWDCWLRRAARDNIAPSDVICSRRACSR